VASLLVFLVNQLSNGDFNMAGSIRSVLGFFLVFGALGGLDNGSDLASCVGLAAVGLALLASGVDAMNTRKI
jgi:hypothetical protein